MSEIPKMTNRQVLESFFKTTKRLGLDAGANEKSTPDETILVYAEGGESIAYAYHILVGKIKELQGGKPHKAFRRTKKETKRAVKEIRRITKLDFETWVCLTLPRKVILALFEK